MQQEYNIGFLPSLLKSFFQQKREQQEKPPEGNQYDYGPPSRGGEDTAILKTYSPLRKKINYHDPLITDYFISYYYRAMAKVYVSYLTSKALKVTPKIYDVNEAGQQIETDTPFSLAINNLIKSQSAIVNPPYTTPINLLSTIKDGDSLAGVGEYGGIVLYYRGQSLDKRVTRRGGNTLTHAIGYGCDKLTVNVEDEKITGYTLNDTNDGVKDVMVHPSRVIHITDNGLTYHMPRMATVYEILTALDNIRVAVMNNTSEATKATLINHNPVATQTDTLKAEMAYIYQRAKALATGASNIVISNGNTQFLDPKLMPFEEQEMALKKALATELRVPFRIFVGNEVGSLASTQDGDEFEELLQEHRELHITPHILQPLINRLTLHGVVPEPLNSRFEYKIKWPMPKKVNNEAVAAINTGVDAIVKMGTMTPERAEILTNELINKMIGN
jgi:hypothetical protein